MRHSRILRGHAWRLPCGERTPGLCHLRPSVSPLSPPTAAQLGLLSDLRSQGTDEPVAFKGPKIPSNGAFCGTGGHTASSGPQRGGQRHSITGLGLSLPAAFPFPVAELHPSTARARCVHGVCTCTPAPPGPTLCCTSLHRVSLGTLTPRVSHRRHLTVVTRVCEPICQGALTKR